MAYRSISVWLEDVANAIENIELFIEDIHSPSQFLADKKTISATERSIEIIAEALKEALKIEPELPITDARKIIGLRNIINHVYYKIDYERIYVFATRNMVTLKLEVHKLLEDFEKRLDLNEL